MQKTILLVDDDAFLMQALAELLRGEDYTVFEANGVKKALRLCEQSLPDVVIADYRMPGLNGVHLLDTHRKLYPDTPIVMMSAFGTLAITEECLSRGATDFLVKPFAAEELLGLVSRLTGTVAIAVTVEPLPLEEATYPLLGHAACMRRLFRAIVQQRHQQLPLCIIGEKGVGKRQVALNLQSVTVVEDDVQETDSKIYKNDARVNGLLKKNFMQSVNCLELVACLPAYQRALRDSGGCSDVAMPAVEQVLIDVLGLRDGQRTVFIHGLSSLSHQQFMEVCPLLEHISALLEDGRVRLFIAIEIADTPVSLLARDWAERLAWESITVPALRQRSDDVAILIAHVLQRCANELDKKLQLAQTAYEQLLGYPWPGNVDELYQRLRRAAVQAQDGVINEAELDLPLLSRQTDSWKEKLNKDLDDLFAQEDGAVYEKWMNQWELVLLRFAIKHCKGNRYKMAEVLGLHRTTLRKKMRGLNIFDS